MEPPYELATWTEVVGDQQVALTGLADFGRSAVLVDRFARERALDERVDLSPMFGVIWPACRALAARVAEDPDLPGTDVIELACGLALPSLVAARRGARVLATDQHPHTEAFLRRNLASNGVDVAYLAVDLRALPPLPRFGRVLASDVLYARDLPELVAGAFATLLAPDGVGWLADPGRAWLPELLDACAAHGLAVREEIVPAGDDEVWLLTVNHAGGS